MCTNEHGSKRRFILVNPDNQQPETNRKAKTFKDDSEALSYAREGDQLLEIFEDGTVQRATCGATSGAQMGSECANALLYCSDDLDRDLIISMCTHQDEEARTAFIGELVDFAIERALELRDLS